MPHRAPGTAISAQDDATGANAALPDSVFRSAFVHAPEAIALSRESDGMIVEVNLEWSNLTGYTRGEILGTMALDLGHWPDTTQREHLLETLRDQGRISDAEVSFVMKGGQVRLLRLDARRLQLDSKPHVLIHLRDVTAERLAQEALRAGERVLEVTNEKLNRQVQLYELTESMARVGYWVTYPGEDTVHFSRGYAAIGGLGDARSATLGEHAQHIHEDDRETFRQALKRADGRTTEFRWRHVDGHWLWVRTVIQRQVEHGSLRAHIGIVQEVTAEKQALQQLQESEARFRSLTELSADWYWEQDEELRFTQVHGSHELALAAPPQAFVGKTRWASGAQGVSEERWAAHKAQLMARQAFQDFEMQRVDNHGVARWVSISGMPVFDAAGHFRGYRGIGRDITARKKAESDIERLAFFDALTGLPNRRLLMDRLQQGLEYSARNKSYGALLFIDLDNFKTLNDTLGHHRGDELLQQVADRLAKCVRSADTVARFGGDEFVVMLEGIGEDAVGAAALAESVAKKIVSALNQDFNLSGHLHHSSPSIGVTLFHQHDMSIEDLLKRADLAMYQAKAAGRNTLRFFDPDMQAAASSRATLETDMRQGLARGEYELYYQPVVDSEGVTQGVEALLRWVHPHRGMVSPAEFIPVAEQNGLIVPLGLWVLQAACRQLELWSHHAHTRRLTIAVNVSARQFRHPDFCHQVLELLRITGANPYRLKLELTESMLLGDTQDIVAKMTELRSIGVSFSLDDFGTGYSSLSYLKRLPLDQLKIDQSFVRDVLLDPNDAAIARTILRLAQSLDLSVVAEGVEDSGQRDFLMANGCILFQGYYFGRPVPVSQLSLSGQPLP